MMPDQTAYGSSPAAAMSDGAALYLTVDAVAHLLQVTTTTVTRMVASDPTMPCLRLGRRTLRFPRERLLVWLRTREQGPAARPRARRLTLSAAKPLPHNGAA